jgi:curved DNA-binding protein CbpA
MTRGADDEPEFDPYKTLQVDPDADVEIVQVVYRRLARKFHPDVMSDPEAKARMIEINAAWEILGNPQRRADHDRTRASRAMPTEASATAGPRGTASGTVQGTGRGPTAQPGGEPGAAARAPGGGSGAPPPRPETVSRDWSSGRSSTGGGYDAARMRTADGKGAAGPPPGKPSGTVLNFGRYAGWSLGEIARTDLEYLEWLDRMTIGRTYRDELDAILRKAGRRRSAPIDDERRGLFRRR